MALTAGWVAGPVLGSILATAAGPRVMLAATGLCALAQIVPLGFARTGPGRPGAHTAPAPEVQAGRRARRPEPGEMLPLPAFTGLYVLVYAGEPIKYGYLPVYLHDGMHLPAPASGAVIGIQPLIELILMPVAVAAARRTVAGRQAGAVVRPEGRTPRRGMPSWRGSLGRS
jgi:MFS transporter, SET family, sugar efflux transporter